MTAAAALIAGLAMQFMHSLADLGMEYRLAPVSNETRIAQ